MAYGLRYTLKQILRDSSLLTVNVYEDSYPGSIYNYIPTSISISPNSNSDEPEPGIISSQLNFSFIVSTTDDFTNFPDLLSYNDRKYYVELTRTDTSNNVFVLWRGFMFNDYVNVPFTTGNVQVDITCIDAISFMKNNIYAYPENVNETQNLYSIVSSGLNSIGYPNITSLYQCCSYFGSLMVNRSTVASNEPFTQTYIYKRDLVGANYYDLIEQIVKSFGCRLFQQNGDWWIISANEMASNTIYYTKFNLSNNTYTGGTLDNSVTISPYNGSNIYFVNNSQNKITRKGYPVVKVTAPVKYANDYISNSTFKLYGAGYITNWNISEVGSATVTLIPYASEPYNVVQFTIPSGGGATTLFRYTSPGILPYFSPPGFTFTFDTAMSIGTSMRIRMYVENTIGEKFYVNSTGVWQAPGVVTYFDVEYTAAANVFQTITYNLELGAFKIGSTNYNVEGFFRVEFECVTAGTILLRYPHAYPSSNGSATSNSLVVTRYISTTNSLTKEFDTYLGIYKSDLPNCYGALYYSNNNPITSWYRYSHIGTNYAGLPILLARELSNLFNRNYATLEADLGETIKSNNIIYLNNTYSITDSSLTPLSYNNKKFLANRTDIKLYINEENNLQLLEITDIDNTSTELISWLSD
jgi:hypothetical protein